jgi:hypothetical protein
MSRFIRRRPSPSMVVAFVALCVALAGTATALPGRNRVKQDDISRAAVRSKHIKSNAILSKHIKARAVTRSKLAKRAIGSDQVGQDALTGANIAESSLATVPNASNATNAGKVNGRSVEKIAFVAGGGTGPTTVLNLNGLTLVATCLVGPALSVSAGTSVSGALIRSWGSVTGGGAFQFANDAFNAGTPFDPLPASAGGTNIHGTLVYARQDGEVVTATYLAHELSDRCVFAGTATG